MHALAPERVGGQRDELHNLLRLDIEWQLAESLLQKADKMSMAESIELRTPILDRGVAEVAAKIPSALKLPPGGPGKWVLRRTLARKLNESDGRPKKGFPVPLAKWFAESLRDEIESELFSNETAYQSHLDGKRVRAAWDDLLTGKWDGARTIFALWLYERWHRKVVCS
jgi:asparagine synthase (glutamine-hydrolysing)